jgi:cytochrome c-type biogenesis protein
VDLSTLEAAVQQAGVAAILVSFLTGFFFSFNPVALAAIPVSLAFVTRARAPGKALVFGGMFIVGMILTHIVLGALAGLGGQGVQAALGRHWGLLLGPWLILMGLMWPGWIRLPFQGLSLTARRASGPWGAFALGVPFAIAVCPACTPALVVLLGVAAAAGSPAWGAVLLLAFALGRALPIALGAAAMGGLERLRWLSRYQRGFDVAGGVTLVVAGLYMLNSYLFLIPALAG